MTRARILADFGGVTSSATELNALDGITADVTDLNYAKTLYDTGVTAAEFDYLDGVTSAIQTQIDDAGGYNILGGVVTEYTYSSVDYRVHTFLSSGTFSLASSTAVGYFVIGGGGGGALGGGPSAGAEAP